MSFSYDPSRPAADATIEPARVQFIEREFGDALRTSGEGELLRKIHDALFVTGESVSSVHARLQQQRRGARVLAVTSGKGGVGKTTVSVNLSVALAGRGLRVVLFDADLGMANVHVFAGVRPRGTLSDVM